MLIPVFLHQLNSQRLCIQVVKNATASSFMIFADEDSALGHPPFVVEPHRV